MMLGVKLILPPASRLIHMYLVAAENDEETTEDTEKKVVRFEFRNGRKEGKTNQPAFPCHCEGLSVACLPHP